GRGRRLRIPGQALPRAGPHAGDPYGASPPRRASGSPRRGRVARGGACGPQGDRTCEGPADGEGEALGTGSVRRPAEGEPGLGAAAEGDCGSRRRDAGRPMTGDHPNAALTRRLFDAFGRDPKVIAAALARDVVWRVPGNTVMSGEYRGLREV